LIEVRHVQKVSDGRKIEAETRSAEKIFGRAGRSRRGVVEWESIDKLCRGHGPSGDAIWMDECALGQRPVHKGF